MIPIRHSSDTAENDRLREQPRVRPSETTRAWLERTGVRAGVLLLGGTSLTDFRVRVAQSHLRNDLLPSLWSQAGIVTDLEQRTFWSVPLGTIADASSIPVTNGVTSCDLRAYDNPRHFPNLALIDFGGDPQAIAGNVEKIRAQRSIVDLVSLLVPWLAFVWGAGKQGNPLLDGAGIPSAALVESAYGLGGLELTPGLASHANCPEAMWQSAKWWRTYYEQAGKQLGATVPSGCYVIGQRAAAVVERTRG